MILSRYRASRARAPRYAAAALLAATIAFPLAARAQTSTEHLIAVSKTAMAITGDIVLREREGAAVRIAFANGKTMTLSGGTDGVYRVVRFGNPVMLNGNRICTTPVKRVTLTEGRDGTYTLAAYGADAMNDKSLCGTFTYATK